MKSKLDLLREELARVEREQSCCEHDWDEPFNDYTEEPVYETVWRGVDCWPEIVRYNRVPCLARVCKKCGKKEISTEMEEVVVRTKMAPKWRHE